MMVNYFNLHTFAEKKSKKASLELAIKAANQQTELLKELIEKKE